ncbi:DUF5455 family protein [Vibrio ostreicida]|uniref:DUF5455 family protein n=1 Tax=Vibrio ostreicida TaxID=526588 RepID=UPI000970763A|nr:DUF5455 family protein [Vibrio ostreicida]
MPAPLLLPVLVGIGNALRLPAIAMFFGQLAASVLGWFAVRMTRSLAMNLAMITLLIGLATTVSFSLFLLASGLSYVAPPSLSQAFSFFVPSNAIPCMSVIFSARVIRWVWTWQFFVITTVSS